MPWFPPPGPHESYVVVHVSVHVLCQEAEAGGAGMESNPYLCREFEASLADTPQK